MATFVLFPLLFAIMGYGYMFSFRQAISQSAAEGARAAVIDTHGSQVAQKSAAVNAVNRSLASYDVVCNGTTLTHAGKAAGTCTVDIGACGSDPAVECVRVRLEYAYRDNQLVPSIGIPVPATLRYTASAEVS